MGFTLAPSYSTFLNPCMSSALAFNSITAVPALLPAQISHTALCGDMAWKVSFQWGRASWTTACPQEWQKYLILCWNRMWYLKQNLHSSSPITKYIPEKWFLIFFFSCSQSLVCLHTVLPEQQLYMVKLLCYLLPVALEGRQLWECL